MRLLDTPHRFSLATVVTAALIFAAPAAAADDLRITDSSLATEDPVTVGDELTYTVEIEHPGDIDIDLSSPPEGSRWSEVGRHLDTSNATTTRATVDYAVFRPGPTSGPPVDLIADGEPASLALPRYELHVTAVTDEDASLGDPRSPWPVWSEHRTLLWLSFGAVGFGLFAVAGALFLRRRGDDPAAPPPPPHVVALDALERLTDEFPTADDEYKPFYFQLSHTIRRYLGQRFGFPGAELTTTELIDKLDTVDPPGLSASEVARWLKACDRVKFAGHLPETEGAQTHLKQAFDFVETTRPDPEQPQGPKADDPHAEESI